MSRLAAGSVRLGTGRWAWQGKRRKDSGPKQQGQLTAPWTTPRNPALRGWQCTLEGRQDSEPSARRPPAGARARRRAAAPTARAAAPAATSVAVRPRGGTSSPSCTGWTRCRSACSVAAAPSHMLCPAASHSTLILPPRLSLLPQAGQSASAMPARERRPSTPPPGAGRCARPSMRPGCPGVGRAAEGRTPATLP